MHSGSTKPYVPMSAPLEEDIIFVIGGCSYLMREKWRNVKWRYHKSTALLKNIVPLLPMKAWHRSFLQCARSLLPALFLHEIFYYLGFQWYLRYFRGEMLLLRALIKMLRGVYAVCDHGIMELLRLKRPQIIWCNL